MTLKNYSQTLLFMLTMAFFSTINAQTISDDLEVVAPSGHNAFISVLTTVSRLKYSTYYGNTQNTSADCLAVQPLGFDNHIITAGSLDFLTGEADGFLPLEDITGVDDYYLEDNPLDEEPSNSAHITEWGPFTIAEEIELENLNNIFLYNQILQTKA